MSIPIRMGFPWENGTRIPIPDADLLANVQKRMCDNEHSRDQTVSSDFVDWNSEPMRHETEYSEDDEAAEDARRAVNDCSNDGVPATL